MKSYLKIVILFALSVVTLGVYAQTEVPATNGLPVSISKEVQRYSNKSLSTDRQIKVESKRTPSVVQSKGVHRTFGAETGNIRSTGAPRRAISKPVNLLN